MDKNEKSCWKSNWKFSFSVQKIVFFNPRNPEARKIIYWIISKCSKLYNFERLGSVRSQLCSRAALYNPFATRHMTNGFVSKYSQTWANDHLRITTTCVQRPLFWGPIFTFYSIKLPLNNDHLSTTATIFGSRGWSFYTSFHYIWPPLNWITDNRISWIIESL